MFATKSKIPFNVSFNLNWIKTMCATLKNEFILIFQAGTLLY